jgi:hypothetical protein
MDFFLGFFTDISRRTGVSFSSKMKRYGTIIMAFLLFYGCSTKQGAKPSSNVSVPTDTHSGTILDKPKKVNALSINELQKLEQSSKIGRMIIFDNGKNLNFSSDGELSYAIFGRDNRPNTLQSRYNDLFKIDHVYIKTPVFTQDQLITRLKFRNSFIKLYDNPEEKVTDIVSARIADKGIIVAFNIKIGMSLSDFFDHIFVDSKNYDFSSVDTVINGDELGEIKQFFIFKRNKLKEILIKSDYDWNPFKFNGQPDSLAKINIHVSCEDGTNKAISDASKGKYRLLSYGLPICVDWDFQNFYEEYMLEAYGIDIGNGGCVVSEESECYSKKMREIIYEKFGKDIFDRAESEAQEKYKISIKERIDTGFIFSIVDTMPVFIGGFDSLTIYLQNNLKHVENSDGEVIAMFVIEKNGAISNITIQKSLNKDADLDVIRVMSGMPYWKPGIHHGQKARVRLALPIMFSSKSKTTNPNKK